MDKYLRPCIAEMVGTFFLCFIGAGTICADAITGHSIGLLGIAIAHGLALSIAVTATMNISGGHVNPAVTVTMWVFKKIDTDKMLLYILFQLLGGVIAGGLLFAFFANTAAATEAHLGTPHINTELLRGADLPLQLSAIGMEAILTFLLVFAVFGTAVDPRAPKVGGFGIGLTICADILMGGVLTGASMNPARTFGPAVWELGLSGFQTAFGDHAVYWIGPIIGGMLAGGLYINCILPVEHTRPVEPERREKRAAL